jgi:hypothetical protein
MLYLAGVIAFFVIVIGVPALFLSYHAPTCFDGIQNQGETDVDKGGPCVLLDERTLQPYNQLWARSFSVRAGGYNAVAYILNPNSHAGVESVGFRFSLYDENNVLVAEHTGTTFVMPGSITPIFDGPIQTGNRTVAHTQFTFTEPLVWKNTRNSVKNIYVDNKIVSETDTTPHVVATVHNTDISEMDNVTFVATVFDTAGNAFATSRTLVPVIPAGGTMQITFTWPNAFTTQVGQVDILPILAPVETLPSSSN